MQWLRLLRTAETLRHRMPDISMLVTTPAAVGSTNASDANTNGSTQTQTAPALAAGSDAAAPLEYQPQAAMVSAKSTSDLGESASDLREAHLIFARSSCDLGRGAHVISGEELM